MCAKFVLSIVKTCIVAGDDESAVEARIFLLAKLNTHAGGRAMLNGPVGRRVLDFNLAVIAPRNAAISAFVHPKTLIRVP